MARRTRATDPKKTARTKYPEQFPVETIQPVHPQVWKVAMKLAHNDAKLIRIESYGRVIVG